MVDVTIHGPNGTFVAVRNNRLQAKAIIETQLENISAEKGQAYSYASTFATGGSDIEVMTIKNDLDQDMHIDQVWVGAADLAIFSIGHVVSGTPAGTTITGNPLNHRLGQVADTTAFGNAAVTGTVVVKDMAWLQTPADTTLKFDLEGAWIFGKDGVFGIRCVTNTTVFVTVILHMDDKE